tara:strand:- start:15827 stop:20248 length:4422 start_codon:yes stop_codon:yes gene_type:complete
MKSDANEIAIVGLSFEFPNTNSLDKLWEGLLKGSCFYNIDCKKKNNNEVSAFGSVKNIEGFDYRFFGYSYKEACYMDPQHRLLLQHSFNALENAGYMNKNSIPVTGVFASASINRYLSHNLSGQVNPDSEDEIVLGNTNDFLATRIAYKLGLKGPALNIQSGCSSSLSSLHSARISLLTNQCEMALVGAVSLSAPHDHGYKYSKEGIRSKNGEIRAFDKDASGTVFTNGIAVIVLKKLVDAKAASDNILGIISSSALNNDGDKKASFTAPSSISQAQVIAKAMRIAKIGPENMVLLEAHGTGTNIGDPIEFNALQKIFSKNDIASSRCALQTIKSNVGHLDTVSGLAGIIKAILVLKNKKIPPQINFKEENPKLDLKNSGLYINETEINLKNNDLLDKYAGVSAFGIGGTNAHVILRMPNNKAVNNNEDSNKNRGLILLSAKSNYSFNELCKKYIKYSAENVQNNVANISYTSMIGRMDMPIRKAVFANSMQNLAEEVKKIKIPEAVAQNKIKPVVFLFPGQGSQYLNMGRQLYKASNIFKESLDRNLDTLEKLANKDFVNILFNSDVSSQSLYKTENTQPILLAFEVSLAEYLQKINIKPAALLGHSLGEFTALVVSKVLSFKDAARLVLKRSELMSKTPFGKMLSVICEREALKTIIPDNLDIAAWNTSNLVTVSGACDAIDDFVIKCNKLEIITQPLPTKHAFHSRLLDSILDEFRLELQKVEFKKPLIPIVSNLDGKLLSYERLSDVNYWLQQMRYPVEFIACVTFLKNNYNPIFMEVGPGVTLKTLTDRILFSDKKRQVINTLPHPKDKIDAMQVIQQNIGVLWENGHNIDWSKISSQTGLCKRIPIPVYSFELKKCWVNSNEKLVNHKISNKPGAYHSFWKQKSKTGTKISLDDYKIIVTNDHNLDFKSYDNFELKQASNEEEINALILGLQNESKPIIIINLCLNEISSFENAFYLLKITKACEKLDKRQKVKKLFMITSKAIALQSNVVPEAASLQTAVKVINQEKALFKCRLIDLNLSLNLELKKYNNWQDEILDEICYDNIEPLVALRCEERFIEDFEYLPLLEDEVEPQSISQDDFNGSIVILGGSGHVGMQYAKAILRNTTQKIFLVQRSFVDKNKLCAAHEINEILRERLHILSADIADHQQLLKACNKAISIGGKISTLIHAAGVDASMHYKLLNDVDTDFYEKCFYAKRNGLINIVKITKEINVSHCHIISSISSTLGGIGMFVYGSLHAYIDNFVLDQQRKNKLKWTSINWEAWEFGTNDDEPEDFQQGAFGEHLDALAIKPEVGCNIISSLWGRLDKPVVISSSNLIERYNNWVLGQVNVKDMNNVLTKDERPEMQIKYESPVNDIEKSICSIWSNILAIDNIGANDNFFELGGHSLMALQMVSILNKTFNQNLSIIDLFQFPTIRKLTEKIIKKDCKDNIKQKTRQRAQAKSNALQKVVIKRKLLKKEISKTKEK